MRALVMTILAHKSRQLLKQATLVVIPFLIFSRKVSPHVFMCVMLFSTAMLIGDNTV